MFFDRDFSLLNWLQAQDRIHRISQVKKSKILVLEAKDTIEERVDMILQRKTSFQSALLDGFEVPENTDAITSEEVIRWLSGK